MHLLALLPLLLLPFTEANPVNVKRYSGVKIQSYRSRKCLSPAGNGPNYNDGTQVITVDCANAKTWDINPGSGSIILHGNGKAIDAGTGRDNNEIVKLWTSYPTLFQQTWYLTGDARIAITGGDQCLDEGDNGPQTYKCTTGNTNQIWYIVNGDNPQPPASSSVAPSSSSAKPSASASSSVKPSASASASATSKSASPQPSQGGIYKDPSNTSRRIHPNGRNDLCVTADNGNLSNGVVVNVAYCYPNDSPIAKSQLWNIAAGSSNDFIRSASNSSLCLDVGYNPGSGSKVLVTPCDKGSDHKKWDYMADKIKVTGKNYCLDLQLGSGPRGGSPVSTQADLQVWECFAGNTQQIFTLFAL
ncbi:hypothetical protein IAU59_001458 [Kwoniella sp. CBS 9459]